MLYKIIYLVKLNARPQISETTENEGFMKLFKKQFVNRTEPSLNKIMQYWKTIVFLVKQAFLIKI